MSACASNGGITATSRAIDPDKLAAGSNGFTELADARWPSERWWQSFGDPQLNTLVNGALADNPSIRIAIDRIRVSQAQSEVVRAGLLPQLDGTADLDRQHVSKAYIFPPPLGGGDSGNDLAGLNLSYDLDLWGKTRRQWEGALAEDQAVRLDARESTLMLETAVVRTYIQLALAFSVREVAAATLHRRQEVLDITRRRLSVGITAELEVSEAEAELAPAQVLLEQADESIATLRNQLAALIGKGPGDGASIQPPTLSLERTPALPDFIPANLVGRRPDIVAARWRVLAAGKNIDVARTQFYPDMNLTGMAGLQSITMASFLTGDALTYAVGPAISLPIFEGGKLRANLDRRSGEYDLAVDLYNQSVIDAVRDVANTLVTVRSSAVQGQLTETALAASQKAFDQATIGFKAGVTEYLSVLTTETALLQQRQNLARIVTTELDAKAQLALALGGGFKVEDDDASAFQKTLADHAASDGSPLKASEIKP